MTIDLLFADGDASLRELYQAFFTRRGLQVDTASSGEQCLAKLRSAPPRSLILDVELLSGADSPLLSAFREEHAFLSVPLVIATGDGSPEQLSELTHLPVDCCFTKPYSLLPLLTRLRSGSAGSHVLDEIGAHSLMSASASRAS